MFHVNRKSRKVYSQVIGEVVLDHVIREELAIVLCLAKIREEIGARLLTVGLSAVVVGDTLVNYLQLLRPLP